MAGSHILSLPNSGFYNPSSECLNPDGLLAHLAISSKCNNKDSGYTMHSMAWSAIFCPHNQSISSKLMKEKILPSNSVGVSANYLPASSKLTKISKASYLMHSVRWAKRNKSLRTCTPGEDEAETEPDVENPLLSGVIKEEIDTVLSTEENQALLKDLEAAMQRVDSAKQELTEVEEREKNAAELRAYIQRLEGVDSMIAECQREVSEAEARVRKAELALITARAGNSVSDLLNKWEERDIDEDVERAESLKASAVSALVGTMASIPIGLFEARSAEGFLISEAIIFISCALFGVTYRYTVRRDLENIQLKAGTVAAFGLVRGLSQIEAEFPINFELDMTLSYVLEAALKVGESAVVFIFSAIALDYCLKMNLLSPFPYRR